MKGVASVEVNEKLKEEANQSALEFEPKLNFMLTRKLIQQDKAILRVSSRYNDSNVSCWTHHYILNE